jgi:hypothetical protein
VARWFILRTGGPQTLPLARSLADAGYDVWTPARTIRRVIGQGTRKGARVMEQDVPILPTFVFAREPHLFALAAEAGAEISPHPRFSIFRQGGRVPLVGDAEVRGLQEEEARAAATMQAVRDAESHAEAERVRIAAIKSEAARRRATAELERGRLAALRAQGRSIAPGTEVVVVENAAFTGVTGIVEESGGPTALVRFGARSWKIDAWQLSPAEHQAPRGIAA